MNACYVVDAVRTPIGKYGGALSSVRPDNLLATAIKALLSRHPNIDPATIEEVIAGAANQAGEDNRNVARMAVLLAGLPVSVAGVTVNRLCASGLQAIMDAARAIQCGHGLFYIAAGVESMTRAPFVTAKSANAWDRKLESFDTTMGWRFVNPELAKLYHPYTMGETAERVAKQWSISRDSQDLFALQSQEKYEAAFNNGIWNDEIIAVEILNNRLVSWFLKDEHPRKTSLEQLAKLKPAFLADGSVTAGNSSGINDGAAAVLLASEEAIKLFQLKPMAKIVSMAAAGVDPSIMGIGPVPASRKAIDRAGLRISDLGLIELNEAFASQSLACIQELGLDPSLVNVNGGAIALGHPLGCSGVRIATTLLHQMQRADVKFGLSTMCVGVGQGASMIFEKC